MERNVTENLRYGNIDTVSDKDKDFIFSAYDGIGEAVGSFLPPMKKEFFYRTAVDIEKRVPGCAVIFFNESDTSSPVPVGYLQMEEKSDVLKELAFYDDEGLYKAAEAREDFIYVETFYVRSEYRGQGVFRAMLAYVTEFARNSGVNAVLLSVMASNPTAMAVYEKCGFVNDGHRVKIRTEGCCMRLDVR